MKIQILSVKAEKSIDKRYGFAVLPTIAIEAHPTHKTWHLIWLECYEVYQGRKWLITN